MSRAVTHFYQFGEFTVDGDQKVLLRKGIPRSLPPKIFDTLLILVENAGRLVGKDELMNQLWPDTFVEESNLTFSIRQLRKSLGDDARQPRFIETVPRRGYRFIAPVEERLSEKRSMTARAERTSVETVDPRPPVTAEIATEPQTTVTTTGWSGARLRKTVLVAGAVVVVLAATIGGWLIWSRSRRPQPSVNKLMLAVLPFENLTGDASQDYFSDGLTEEMISQLGNLDPQHLGVIARTSVMHYKNHQEGLDQIGRELGVQYVLEGSVRRESDHVRITAQLIQVKDQSHLWSREYDRELSHLLLLQDEIAQDVVGEIRTTLGETQKIHTARQTAPSPPVYEAYDLYLKGQYFFNKRTGEGFEQAIDYFQQATTKDPQYARAYAGLADCYALIGGYIQRSQTDLMPKARAAAMRAVELDGNLAEAHTALALIVQNYDWDWPGAGKEFRRAIELNPNYATAHQWYAEHLTWLGRFDDALRESELARELDPLSLIIAADEGANLYYARQYDRAIAQFRAVREMDPTFPRTGVIRFAYEQKGVFNNPLDEIQKWRRVHGDQPWTWSELAYIYGKTGQSSQAEHALQKLLQLDQREPVDPGAIVMAFIGVGDKDQAFAYLEKAYSRHSNILTTLKVEPRMDSLRDDARFHDLLQRVHLAD